MAKVQIICEMTSRLRVKSVSHWDRYLGMMTAMT